MTEQPDTTDFFANSTMEKPRMNELMPFEFEGHTVRVIDRDRNPWWVRADVCKVLGIANPRDAASRLDDDEKGVVTTDTLGGPQEVAIINKPGLYKLILTSRKPEAKRFTKWVTSEVIPTIRRTGSYSSGSARQPSILTTEVLRDIERMAEEIVASELLPLVQALKMLEQKIQALKAAPVTIPVDGDFWPMKRIVRAAGVGQTGRGRLVHRCTASLKKWLFQNDRAEAIKIIADEEGRDRYVFALAAVDDWMAVSGAAILDAHKALHPTKADA